MFIKFAFVKWLPLAVITSGLSQLIAVSIPTAPVLPYWLAIMLITLGLELFGEYRHYKAMAAKAAGLK